MFQVWVPYVLQELSMNDKFIEKGIIVMTCVFQKALCERHTCFEGHFLDTCFQELRVNVTRNLEAFIDSLIFKGNGCMTFFELLSEGRL